MKNEKGLLNVINLETILLTVQKFEIYDTTCTNVCTFDAQLDLQPHLVLHFSQTNYNNSSPKLTTTHKHYTTAIQSE